MWLSTYKASDGCSTAASASIGSSSHGEHHPYSTLTTQQGHHKTIEQAWPRVQSQAVPTPGRNCEACSTGVTANAFQHLYHNTSTSRKRPLRNIGRS
ncbi:hypothetical protein HPB50_023506 [Hyalomma asiaticum]|uniref:Uncharacterized protein n=1 Tax=Hyalomma asiaticum TaxID=266040 RepID=A0ACB7S7Z2_HYAAI|nr:hypothetical protein HPB50_023506 [Hyalomma asiaticum]